MLMPGHLLLYHPGVQKLKELVDDRRARRRALRLRQPPEPRDHPQGRERALVARRARPVGDPLPDRRGAERGGRARQRVPERRASRTSSFCYLRFPSGKIAHMHLSWLDPHKMRKITVVGREKMVVFDDMELERKVTIYDKAPEQPAGNYGEWRTRTGDIFSPKIANDEPLRLECAHFLRLVEEGPATSPRPAPGSRSCARSSCCSARSARPGDSRDPPDRDRLPGNGARRGREGARARRRRQAADASPRSTAKREPLPPTVIGDGHDRLDRRDRVRRARDRRARDPRRPVVRARARDDRRRRRRRPRLARRERHDDRRADEDPGGRLHHRLLDARGGRLHRAVRRHDERQLHGPHRAAARR